MRWAVVGGGMLGLTIALRLRQQGHSVTVLEAADRLGGLAAPWNLGDVVWDRHYHVTLLSDTKLRTLLRELDLDDEIDWRITKTGFYAQGRLHPMSNSIEYLRLPSLGLGDKIRLAATILQGARLRDWKPLERMPVEEWLVRLSGRSTFEKLWLPLLRAKLGESYRETNAAFIWATIQRLYAARRSGLKREMFGSVRGGYARILERFEERLRAEGVEIRTGVPVGRVAAAANGGVEIAMGAGSLERWDAAVVTAPAPIAAKMCPGLRPEETQRLGGVRYQGIVCASMLLPKELTGYYLTYITEPDCPFTAIVEMTTLVDPRHVGGKTLVYLPKYVSADDPFYALPDAEVESRFLGALERMLPGFRRDDVLAFRISRVKHVFAIPTVGDSERRPRVETSVPGLYTVSAANIVNGTLNVNETVGLAEDTARILAAAPAPAGAAAAAVRADAGAPSAARAKETVR
jgi:protoporphyrinogen oxidase